MGIEDEYAAFCLDETCLFMIQQAREKREPDFGRPARLEKQKGRQKEELQKYTLFETRLSRFIELLRKRRNFWYLSQNILKK